MVKYTKEGDTGETYHIVTEQIVFPGGEPIHELQMVSDGDGIKYLILSTHASIKRVKVERCHLYSGCTACLRARDPYCGWSEQLQRCIPTSHRNVTNT